MKFVDSGHQGENTGSIGRGWVAAFWRPCQVDFLFFCPKNIQKYFSSHYIIFPRWQAVLVRWIFSFPQNFCSDFSLLYVNIFYVQGGQRRLFHNGELFHINDVMTVIRVILSFGKLVAFLTHRQKIKTTIMIMTMTMMLMMMVTIRWVESRRLSSLLVERMLPRSTLRKRSSQSCRRF